MRMRTVAVVGLGRVGLPMAACFASRGHRVIGLDTNPDRVTALAADTPTLQPEPGLLELILQNRSRLEFTSDFRRLGAAETIFIIVPTPSNDDGGFSLHHILAAVEGLGPSIATAPDYRLVVVASTVMPGATEAEIRPALERAADRECGDRLGLCYSPEFIALGRVLHDLQNPDFVLIGESDERAGDALRDFYATIQPTARPVHRMNFVNAELTKLAVNAYVTMKISFANFLSEMSERLRGGNVHVVTAALGNDRRIGSKYLTGATAFGGPCFPRDNRALTLAAETLRVTANLPEAADAVNERQTDRLAALLSHEVKPGCRVAVLGLAYRSGTDVLEASAGVDLARRLVRNGYRVAVYEASGLSAAQAVLGGAVDYANTLDDAVEGAAGIVLCLPDPEFRELHARLKERSGSERPVVLDCWGLLDERSLTPRIRYIRLGQGPKPSRNPVS